MTTKKIPIHQEVKEYCASNGIIIDSRDGVIVMFKQLSGENNYFLELFLSYKSARNFIIDHQNNCFRLGTPLPWTL